MKKNNLFLSVASKFALPTFCLLVVASLAAIFMIRTTPSIYGSAWPGFFETLFDYSRYASNHPARLTGQILSNSVAYLFMLGAVVMAILSLVLIKHDKVLKFKSALIAILLIYPATLGMVGGFVNFIGEGIKVVFSGNHIAGFCGFLLSIVYLLDIAYFFFAVMYLINATKLAVRVNKGEIKPEDLEESPVVAVPVERKETPEEKLQKEEERAERRAQLLEDIRKIVREELERLDRVAIVTAAPAAEEEEEEDEENPNPKAPRAPRVPFAKKLVKADKDLQDKYNELKNEIMAYGASTRLSVSGDTFRLHRKPYVKITLVGKALKVYFALDPKDFIDSPIPVIDASDKNAYAEVPTLLKVKSNLSVKRAKELIALAFNKDGVVRDEKVEEVNYMREIRSELRKK